MITGIGFVQPMFFIGVVENREDPRLEGRVQVRAFGVHGSNRDVPTEDLPWATLIIGNHDVNFTPPPLNAWVFGFFIDGRDAQQPMILGLIPTQATDLVNPEVYGWGAVPLEDYDRQSQGSRPRDIGLSPMSKLATGEFTNETYNEALETNRVRNIPIAGGGIRGHIASGNGNTASIDTGERGPIVASQPMPTEQEVYDGLRARGLSDAAARGIIANMIAESGLDPDINEISPLVEGSRGGYGLIQWTGPRRRALEAEAARRGVPVNDLDFQLDYLMIELQTTERASYNSLLGATDAVDAAVIFSQENLRPGIPNLPKRISEAERLMGVQFTGAENAIPSGVDPGLQQAVDERQSRAAAIRQEIQSIQTQIDSLSQEINGPAQAEIADLEARKAELAAELRQLDPNGSTEPAVAEPYSGYMDAQPYAGVTTTWEEPPSAYAAQYPFNRVIETAGGHSIELDDTPGAERITIWHVNGSYIQISPTTTVVKSMQDSYDINEKSHHVYVGGNSIVTIEGDCHVLVKGNKVEEIQGDYKQIVHGNIMVGGAGRVEINGSERTDIRSASLGLDSNVENLNIRTGKNIVFQSGESISLNSKNVRIGASENMSVSGGKGVFIQSTGGDAHVKANGNVFVNPSQNLYARADGGSISMQAQGSFRVNSNAFAAIKSTGYMSLSSDANMLMNATASVNINAGTVLGLSSTGMFMNSNGGNMNLNSGALLNIASSGDTSLNSGAGLFMEASGAGNIKTDALKIEGSTIDMKSGGDAKITGSVVYIDTIVQLASGASAAPADPGNDIEVKEPINAAEFGFGQGEFGGDIADQAANAEPPATATSEVADGMAPPPTRSIPSPTKPSGTSPTLPITRLA